MAGFLTLLAVLGGYGAVLGALVLLAAKVRRSGTSAPILGVFDQIYRPTAERSRTEIAVQDERAAPNPSPDDLDRRTEPHGPS